MERWRKLNKEKYRSNTVGRLTSIHVVSRHSLQKYPALHDNIIDIKIFIALNLELWRRVNYFLFQNLNTYCYKALNLRPFDTTVIIIIKF